uniref:helix-turn-helix transcriptional regulator n=1 Tax=uncultured Altererythrobacter sp. TaxID=500840 RepID=UPI002637B29D|nr:hypothetical protein [uncultured Altererythrobacter sp.]
MASASARKLTERQLFVLERIDRRIPIKVIANDLGVSETRVNQHIRALKDIYKVESLNELVECYREEYGDSESEQTEDPLSESAFINSQLEEIGGLANSSTRVDPGEIVMSDVMPISSLAPWKVQSEPKVVPGMLDGEHATILRLAAIVGIAFGFLAAVVLTVTAAMTISEALDGRATIPVDEQGFT